ncbi:FHA domain-containing protein [Tychonema sp. LEGE 07203]|uniref:FHA domain-containing protein n=1 Tax=Tychonema sp. LEGE 07203 TaxID=1828671 RepID=UPI00187E7C21|nr:FHA domain-containing protein [Tychonema sp. LEGE 07203]
MITLTLLHPIQSVPVQRWCFESASVVRIGRSNDNDVIIYSAVVSRHHVELWNHAKGWEIINFGANGTYVDDRPIAQVSVTDGMTIRLGNSGPKIRISVGATLEPNAITSPPQPQFIAREDEASKEKSTAWPIGVGIIEDDEEGAQTHIDLD